MDGKADCEKFEVTQGEPEKYKVGKKGALQLWITGEKRNYVTETRKSVAVYVNG